MTSARPTRPQVLADMEDALASAEALHLLAAGDSAVDPSGCTCGLKPPAGERMRAGDRVQPAEVERNMTGLSVVETADSGESSHGPSAQPGAGHVLLSDADGLAQRVRAGTGRTALAVGKSSRLEAARPLADAQRAQGIPGQPGSPPDTGMFLRAGERGSPRLAVDVAESPLAEGPGSRTETRPMSFPRTSSVPPPELSRRQAAQLLGIGERTLDRWTSEGRIAHYRLGDRVLYARPDLDRFLAANRREAGRP